MAIIHDTTLWGNSGNPLSISNVDNVQQNRIVEAVIINPDTPLPSGVEAGKRYLKRIKHYEYGALYNKSGLDEIGRLLAEEGNPWSIPTKADWDKLLNSLEPCEEDKNHDSEGEGRFGKYAGLAAKDSSLSGENTVGLSITATGYADSTVVPYSSDTAAYLWCDKVSDEDDSYVKSMRKNDDDVYQLIGSDNMYYAVRLVLNTDRFNSPMADILGKRYGIVKISGTGQYWIKENLDADLDDSKMARISRTQKVSLGYTMCYWNGMSWEKEEITEGYRFYVRQSNSLIEHVTVVDDNGDIDIRGGVIIGRDKTSIDCGWY